MNLLSRRAHFEAELRAKLRSRRYQDAEIEETMRRLRELGYVDDRSVAEQWVAAERRRRAQGRLRLRHRLERKGVASEIVTEVLSVHDDDSELEEARRAARAWDARHAPDPEKLARHLGGRGFAKRAILVVLEERPEVCTGTSSDVGNSDSEESSDYPAD